MSSVKDFLKRKDIVITPQRYLIEALGAMAQGLFASLLIGTIIKTLGQQTGLEVLEGQCDALAALMEREDAASAIVARLEQPRTREGTSMEELTLLIIASDPRIEQQLTAEERDVGAECKEYRMPATVAHAEKEGI